MAGKLTNGLPGSAEYLAAHHKAATELAKVLKNDKLESYKKMAEKWNNPYAIYVQSFGLESESGTWEHSFGSSVGPCGIGSVSECQCCGDMKMKRGKSFNLGKSV